MTHDRLVDLTTKMHEGTRLSVSEAREFAQLIGKGYPGLEAVASRLLTQTYTLDDAEPSAVACKLLLGSALRTRLQ